MSIKLNIYKIKSLNHRSHLPPNPISKVEGLISHSTIVNSKRKLLKTISRTMNPKFCRSRN